MNLEDQGMCFVCGKRNPVGLRVDFDVDTAGLRISGLFTPKPEHEGYAGMMHGGLVGTLLDEAMVKLLWDSGIPAVSAWLEIKLVRPAKTGRPLRVTGRVDSLRGKIILASSRIEDLDGKLVAEANGKCVRVSGKEGPSVGAEQEDRG